MKMPRKIVMLMKTITNPTIISGAFYEIEKRENEIWFFKKENSIYHKELALVADEDVLNHYFFEVNTDDYYNAIESYRATQDSTWLSNLRRKVTSQYRRSFK